MFRLCALLLLITLCDPYSKECASVRKPKARRKATVLVYKRLSKIRLDGVSAHTIHLDASYCGVVCQWQLMLKMSQPYAQNLSSNVSTSFQLDPFTHYEKRGESHRSRLTCSDSYQVLYVQCSTHRKQIFRTSSGHFHCFDRHFSPMSDQEMPDDPDGMSLSLLLGTLALKC